MRRLAFHDTRRSSQPRVVFNVMYDDRPDGRNRIKLFTILEFKNASSSCLPLEYWAMNSAKLGVRKRFKENYFNHIMRTVADIQEAPLYAQISTTNDCKELSDTIPIKDNRTEKTYTYGVCLHKGLYDLKEPEMLVHWIELNLALGAEIITIYLQNVPESYYTMVIPYIKRGVVEVLDWGLRPPLIPEYTKDWGQTGTITECVYRNLYRVKYLGLYDIDEFIVPQRVKKVPEMINIIETRHPEAIKASSYHVENCYFYKTANQLPELNHFSLLSSCPCMKLPRFYTFVLKSFKTNLPDYYGKLIVKPKKVYSVWMHYIWKWMDGYTKDYHIPMEDALVHHYRVPIDLPPRYQNATTFLISRYFNDTVEGIVKNACVKRENCNNFI